MYRFKIKDYTLQQLVHYTAAFVMITKGVTVINTKIFYLAIILFVFGGFILTAALFQKAIEKKFIYINSVLNFTAVIGLALTGFIFMKEGRLLIQIALFFASISYLIAGFISIKSARDVKLQKNL